MQMDKRNPYGRSKLRHLPALGPVALASSLISQELSILCVTFGTWNWFSLKIIIYILLVSKTDALPSRNSLLFPWPFPADLIDTTKLNFQDSSAKWEGNWGIGEWTLTSVGTCILSLEDMEPTRSRGVSHCHGCRKDRMLLSHKSMPMITLEHEGKTTSGVSEWIHMDRRNAYGPDMAMWALAKAGERELGTHVLRDRPA